MLLSDAFNELHYSVVHWVSWYLFGLKMGCWFCSLSNHGSRRIRVRMNFFYSTIISALRLGISEKGNKRWTERPSV